MSLIAPLKGVSTSLMFQWLKHQGTLTAVFADEAVVPASELVTARAKIAKP